MDNPIKPEEEYQFSETESSVFDPSAGRKKPGMPGGGGPRNKNIFILLGTLIAFFIVFKVVTSMMGPKKVVPAVPPAQQATQNNANINEEAAVNRQITTLEQTSADYNNRLEKLESNVSNTVNALSDIEIKLANINNSLQILANEVNQQQTQITALQTANVKPIVKREYGPTVTYTIQAMFPGRAWLTTTGGQTITVRTGSRISGYGNVVDIDTDQGIITTSSGRTIRYNSDDS
jgi:intracellular multiplication protein IcmG